jgi:hypothetical protein
MTGQGRRGAFVEVRVAKEARIGESRTPPRPARARGRRGHADGRPDPVHQVLESVLEVSASWLGRGVTSSIDCKTDLMARFDPALVERAPQSPQRSALLQPGRTDRRRPRRDLGDQLRIASRFVVRLPGRM